MELEDNNVWSRYFNIHYFAQQPIFSVVNLVGGSPAI